MSNFIPGDKVGTIKQFVHELGQRLHGGGHPDNSNLPAVPTVESVDVSKYVGLWYELARMPMLFQPDSTLSTAEYSLLPTGELGVNNIAYDGDKIESQIEGTAKPVEGYDKTHSKLIVQFGGILKWIPEDKDGNYWVMRLADDYSMALVGTPDRKALWLLARDRDQQGSDQARDFLQTAADAYFDLSRLLIDDWEKGVAHPASDVPTADKPPSATGSEHGASPSSGNDASDKSTSGNDASDKSTSGSGASDKSTSSSGASDKSHSSDNASAGTHSSDSSDS